MKIGIFGRHPIPQPGFMGVMSLFEAKYFTRLQNEVDLLIPFDTPESLDRFLKTHDVRSLNDLAKFNASFDIVPVFVGQKFDRFYDVIIYQSYAVQDWENYIKEIRRSCKCLTKNFPKFVPGTTNVWHPSVVNQFKAFDVVACALRSDIAELQGDPKFWARYGNRAVYVPRGADPDLLHPARKIGGPPVIGIDTPSAHDGYGSVAHYAPAIALVRETYPDLRVLMLGSKIPEIEGEIVNFGRFDRIYDRFFNEIWILLTMNYAESAAHVRASVQALHPDDWSGRAIYEVQNVEAQMAGAALFGHQTNLIGELFDPGTSGFCYPDFTNAADIAARLCDIIANYTTIRSNTRHWAVQNFCWADGIARWHQALSEATTQLQS